MIADLTKEERIIFLQKEIEALKREVLTLKNEAGYWRKQHERAREREETLKKELAEKDARIQYLTNQLYAKKSEKKNSKTVKEIKEGKARRGRRKGTPNHPLREHNELPVEVELYEGEEDELYCRICKKPYFELKETEDSELVEIEIKGYKRKIKRKKYARGCECKESKGIIMAKGPVKLFAQMRYGLSIWINILINKYRFQIPVARILKKLALVGVDVPAGTAGDGLKRIAPLFEPIYAALEEKSRAAEWWQGDETRWSVYELPEHKWSYRWYLWVFKSIESVVYIMDPSRSAQVIENHLGEVIDGILLVDRYSAYKSFAKKRVGIILAFCWSHARRDFIEAGKQYLSIKEWALEWEERINLIFHLNRLRLQYPVGSKEFLREEELLRHALEEIKTDAEKLRQQQKPHLHYQQEKVLKSLLNHWEGLTVFVDHPYIPMDNNGSERILRNPAVGRKNYYGSGAIWSGRFSAVMFSIFETLEIWEIDVQQWLYNYLEACAKAGGKPPSDITIFLPWNIKDKSEVSKKYCGRYFSSTEMECIKAIIDEDSSRSRIKIAEEACLKLQWCKPDGGLKSSSMMSVLLKMEQDGYITLPPCKKGSHIRFHPIRHTELTDAKEDIIIQAGSLMPLNIQIVNRKEEHSLWNEYIDRYHYLGYTPLPGASLKYLVYAQKQVVALLGFGASAWRVQARDTFIGWTDEKRIKNLHLIVNNARFLILPWIFSKNLASKILSIILKRIADDWEEKYNIRPVLVETFVEKQRYQGTCYKAANWRWIGATKGRGKKDRFNQISLPVKNIFIYPLDKNFRTLLC
jgi:transposase